MRPNSFHPQSLEVVELLGLHHFPDVGVHVGAMRFRDVAKVVVAPAAALAAVHHVPLLRDDHLCPEFTGPNGSP